MVQYVQIQKQGGEGWLSSVIVMPHINRKIIEVCLFVNIFFYKCTLSGKQFQIKLSETSEKVILFYM